MKRATVAAFLTFASMVGISSMSAQIQVQGVRAIVPFAFVAGNKILPAGVYTILLNDGTVRLESGKADLSFVALAPQANAPSSPCALMFYQRGDQYIMEGVRCESAALSFDLPTSKPNPKAPKEQARLRANEIPIMIAAK